MSHAATYRADRPALVEGETRRTWADLDRLSHQVASLRLRKRVPKGARAGLATPKSARIVAAIHGVLKAGCVCVPVAPSSPVARMNVDCAPAAIFGSAEILSQLALSSLSLKIAVDNRAEDAVKWNEIVCRQAAAVDVHTEPGLFLSFPAELTEWLANRQIPATYAVPSLGMIAGARGHKGAR